MGGLRSDLVQAYIISSYFQLLICIVCLYFILCSASGNKWWVDGFNWTDCPEPVSVNTTSATAAAAGSRQRQVADGADVVFTAARNKITSVPTVPSLWESFEDWCHETPHRRQT